MFYKSNKGESTVTEIKYKNFNVVIGCHAGQYQEFSQVIGDGFYINKGDSGLSARFDKTEAYRACPETGQALF